MNIGHIIDALSVVLRGVALFNFLIFLIPLQIKEAKVQNGLKKLRVQLLIIGVILTIVNTFSIILILAEMHGSILVGSPSLTLRLVNAIAFLILSYNLYMIYHQQYTDEHKRMNKKVHELTKKENKTNI